MDNREIKYFRIIAKIRQIATEKNKDNRFVKRVTFCKENNISNNIFNDLKNLGVIKFKSTGKPRNGVEIKWGDRTDLDVISKEIVKLSRKREKEMASKRAERLLAMSEEEKEAKKRKRKENKQLPEPEEVSEKPDPNFELKGSPAMQEAGELVKKHFGDFVSTDIKEIQVSMTIRFVR